MKNYKLTFNGRENGDIGIFSDFTVNVFAKNEDDARIKLYDTHEHITRLKVEENGVSSFVKAYLQTVLWAETDGENPLDRNFSENDFAPAALQRIIADCEKFLAENSETIQAAIDTGKVKCGLDFDEWGHTAYDFYLTRSGHGAGFWDGDWPEPMAKKLTDAAMAFDNMDYYVGDDGLIYC